MLSNFQNCLKQAVLAIFSFNPLCSYWFPNFSLEKRQLVACCFSKEFCANKEIYQPRGRGMYSAVCLQKRSATSKDFAVQQLRTFNLNTLIKEVL
jgi:hypothetical protein